MMYTKVVKMKTKIVLTAMVAVIMAMAFLPGAHAQESVVTEVREQAATVGGSAGALAGINAALIGMVPAGVLALITPLYAVVLSAIFTIVGGIWAVIMAIGAVIVSVIGTLVSVIGTLGAGLNDIDLGSYLFQTLKISAFALGEPLLYIWNAIGAIHLFPGISWIMAFIHGIAQLGLLWGNLGVRLFQHILPIV